MAGLVLHTIPVAKGSIAITQVPGRDGNYAVDLDTIAAWKPALVLSMTSLAELVDAGAPDFGTDIQTRGCRWAHLPVRDYGTPDNATEKRWAVASGKALQALRGGGRVVIHCRGGCGRSGMAALRLMIEAGENPDTALKRLRAIRDCAVETDAQKAWAYAAAETEETT